MPEVLVDSTIVIDASKHHPRATRYLDKLILSKEAVTHAHVVAEVVYVAGGALRAGFRWRPRISSAPAGACRSPINCFPRVALRSTRG